MAQDGVDPPVPPREPELQPEQPEPEPEPEPEMAGGTAEPGAESAEGEPPPLCVVIVDTDGDITEYRYGGIPGSLEAWCNGDLQQPTVTTIAYDPATLLLRDDKCRMTLPSDPPPEPLVDGLKRLCEHAGVPFTESTGAAQRRVAPWGVALPRCLCVRLTAGLRDAMTLAHLLRNIILLDLSSSRHHLDSFFFVTGPVSSYTRDSMLHIGVSNSRGAVSHFPGSYLRFPSRSFPFDFPFVLLHL